MEVPPDAPRRHRNRLLERLLRECPALARYQVCRSVEAGTELYAEGQAMNEVHFPLRGVVSVVVRLREGGTADVQTIGNEGLVGLPAWLGISHSPDTVLQQASGEMASLPVDQFRPAVQASPHARGLLDSYAAYSFRFSSQTCVCNAHHSVKQRLCRWVLTCADRDGAEELALTQAMLGDMLGVRRQSVSEVLVELHQAGVVWQRRNRICILDRARLQQSACECYATVRDVYARLVEPRL
jgi:CRP-like cAMP-binding protein